MAIKQLVSRQNLESVGRNLVADSLGVVHGMDLESGQLVQEVGHLESQH